MMDTQSPTSSSSDDRTKAADNVVGQHSQTTDGQGNLVQNVDNKVLEPSIANAEQTLDTFLSDLDKFLNKF